jgi:gamma-glutamyltranspeptidase/glutathione hydrolase
MEPRSESIASFLGAAATAHPDATDAAIKMLEAGGNAVDAAAAAAWALCVCEPSGSGLGGQTVLLIHFPGGHTIAVDGHSYAPDGLDRSEMSREEQQSGHRACTVPSTPATLGYIQERHGRLSQAQVMGPAIRLAEEGFPVTPLLRKQVKWCREALESCNSAAEVFLKNGKLPQVDSRLRQQRLGWTLRRVAECGTEDFYRGRIARRIVQDMEDNNGFITYKDLQDFRLPIEREPIEVHCRDHTVSSLPPPAGGIQLLLGLRLLDQCMPLDHSDPVAWHMALADAGLAVFQERSRWPIRPEEFTPSFIDWFLSKEHALEILSKNQRVRRTDLPRDEEGPGETTHLCTADAEGMVVSLTQSIQSLFGAKVMNPWLGFFYNNYLSTCPRYRHPYRLRGGALPLSNASPTIVFQRNGEGKEPILALGAAGSRRIITALLYTISGVLHRGLCLEDAIAGPRLHPFLSGNTWIEKRREIQPLIEALERRFRKVTEKASHSYSMGAVQGLQRGARGNWTAAADPRRDGTGRTSYASNGARP